jgi:hypothetical protein
LTEFAGRFAAVEQQQEKLFAATDLLADVVILAHPANSFKHFDVENVTKGVIVDIWGSLAVPENGGNVRIIRPGRVHQAGLTRL